MTKALYITRNAPTREVENPEGAGCNLGCPFFSAVTLRISGEVMVCSDLNRQLKAKHAFRAPKACRLRDGGVVVVRGVPYD